MLDVRIDTFLTVCKYMNFTRAAEELHITQPAVSHHIRMLEEEYGVRLFAAYGKKFALTEAGRMLRSAAATVKHDDLLLRDELKRTAGSGARLVFGATLTVGQSAVAAPLCRYLHVHPETNVRLVVADTQDLLKRIDAGEIDFAIVEGCFPRSEYDSLVFSSERFLAVCAPDYPFRKPVCRVEDLLRERLLVREEGSGTRNILENYLREKNLQISDFPLRVEASSIAVLKELAAAGAGITFLYEAAVRQELRTGLLREIRLEGFSLTHDFSFLWRRGSVFTSRYRTIFSEFLGSKV